MTTVAVGGVFAITIHFELIVRSGFEARGQVKSEGHVSLNTSACGGMTIRPECQATETRSILAWQGQGDGGRERRRVEERRRGGE